MKTQVERPRAVMETELADHGDVRLAILRQAACSGLMEIDEEPVVPIEADAVLVALHDVALRLHIVDDKRADGRAGDRALETSGVIVFGLNLKEGIADGVFPVGKRLPWRNMICRPYFHDQPPRQACLPG